MLGCESAAIAFASAWKRVQRVAVVDEVLGQHLDRDVALEARVARAVHLAHAAGAERRQDLVRAETGPGREGHLDLQREETADSTADCAAGW